MDVGALISDRARSLEMSGIRRILELARTLEKPINLSIGQPDFGAPEAVKRRAVEAIEKGLNGYALSAGWGPLIERTEAHLKWDLGWDCSSASGPRVMISSGTSGALTLAFLTLLNPGDEAILGDPYFLTYPGLIRMCGATPVLCDTAPDFRLTAERVEPLITERTKFVLVNTPSNPAGVTLSGAELSDLSALCRERGIVLLSDEIYDEFVFEEARTEGAVGDSSALRCPSPARKIAGRVDPDHVLLVRGFGKTYGITGWRLGFCAGDAGLISEIIKLHQHTYVCAPTPLQDGAAAAFDVDMRATVDVFQRRRDLVRDGLAGVADMVLPTGAFYAYPKLPEGIGSATAFVERAIKERVLVIPGGVFSRHDDHFRISLATPDDVLEEGVGILRGLMLKG